MIAQQDNQTPDDPRIGDPALAATLELVYLRPLLRSLPPAWRSAIDVGAHRGEVTAELLAGGFRVVAVEPQDWLADRLRERFAAAIANGRLAVERCAASDRGGLGVLHVGSTSTVSSLEPAWTTVAFPEFFVAPRHVEVPLRPAASLLAAHGCGAVGFAKVDVEGHEGAALRGLLGTAGDAARPPAVVMFEADESFPDRAEACLSLLGGRGYATFDLFVRRGIDPVAGERFVSATLPAAWHESVGTDFYANVIAYHAGAPIDPTRLDPIAFVRRYHALRAAAEAAVTSGAD